MLISHITDHIQKLANCIDSEFEMTSVPIFPGRDAKHSYCYRNVETRVRTHGGKLQNGWSLIQLPFMVEAMHHAVWENPLGHLIDITPPMFPMREAIFIPDDRITYDGRIIENIKMNITMDSAVDDLIQLDRFQNMLLAQSPMTGDGKRAVTHPLWPRYKELGQNLRVFLLAGRRSTDACYCGAAASYADCHGELFRRSIALDLPNEPDLVIRLPFQV